MTYQEIADLAGKSLSAVKVDAHRGKFEKGNEESVMEYVEGAAAKGSERVVKARVASKAAPELGKGTEPLRAAEILKLPVGFVYRGFDHVLVKVMEDGVGNRYLKLFPRCKELEEEISKEKKK